METLRAYWNQLYTTVTEPSAALLIQIGVAVLVFVLLLLLLRRRQPASVPAFDTDSGHIMVSRGAITELVQTACEQIPGVKRPKIRLYMKRGFIDLNVQLKLESNSRLKTISKTLQNHLGTVLRENLGIDQLRAVNILVTGIKSGKLAPPAMTADREEDEEKRPFVLDSDTATSEENEDPSTTQMELDGADDFESPIETRDDEDVDRKR